MKLLQLFRSGQAPAIALKGSELAVLDAVRTKGRGGVCAADLQSFIADVTGKEPRLATLYGIVTDLERKGLLEQVAAASHENGGRPRKLFGVTDRGMLALDLGEAMASHGAIQTMGA